MPPCPRPILAAFLSTAVLATGCTYAQVGAPLGSSQSTGSGAGSTAPVARVQEPSAVWKRLKTRGVPLGVAYLTHPVIDPDEATPTIENLWPTRGHGLAQIVPARAIATDPERLDGPEGASLPTNVTLLVSDAHPSAFVVRLYSTAAGFWRDVEGAKAGGELRRVGTTMQFNDSDPGCAVKFFVPTASAIVWCGSKDAKERRQIEALLAR
jgi:hypothetical protein